MNRQFSSEWTWAESQFGQAQLGDARRTRRLVEVACAMAGDPQGSIPRQHRDWAGTKAAYRLFNQDRVSFESVSQAHWDQTRLAAGDCPVTLLIQDTTWLSFANHPATTGLGRFGNDAGRGLFLHSMLAVEPQFDGEGSGSGRLLGVAHAKLWAREDQVVGRGKKRNQKRKSEDSEALRWGQAVQAVGAPPPGRKFIHVGDRESDIFDLFELIQNDPSPSPSAGAGFVIRLMRQRNAQPGHHAGTLRSTQRPKTSLKEVCRQMSKLGTTRLWIAPRGGRPGRWATLAVAGGPVTIYSPWFGRGGSRTARPLLCWAVRLWEIDAPGKIDVPPGTQPLEWLLLTSEPVNNLEDALRIGQYYSLRWIIEEYHQCLKSGCKVEDRQLEQADRLEPFIGIATAVAARLVQLKSDARLTPDRPAAECVQEELVQTLCRLTKLDPSKLTVRSFTHAVAKMGGFLGRKGDGEPGWKTLWYGWQKLNLIHRGYQLAIEIKDVGNG